MTTIDFPVKCHSKNWILCWRVSLAVSPTTTVNLASRSWKGLAHHCDCHSFPTSDLPPMIHSSCPFQEWSPSYCIQIALSLTLSCIPKVRALACAKNLSTITLRDRETTFTLCSQPASYITSSPSLGHVMPLMSDGCLLGKDGWLMAPILTERGVKKVTSHSGSMCYKPVQMETGCSGASSDKRHTYYSFSQDAILSGSLPETVILSTSYMINWTFFIHFSLF